MTFEAYETSARGGKPTHLFVITRQNLVWRFAAADRDITIDGKTYQAAPISRSNIKQTLEKPQQNITITMPYMLDPNAAEHPVTQAIGDIWHPYIPSDVVSVVCMATHVSDPDQEIRVEWIGEVQQPKYDTGKLELTCVPPGQISKARYQGPKWSRTCQKSVYSTGLRGCNLVPDTVQVTGTVTAVSGVTVTAPEFSASSLSLAGGYLVWTRQDGIVERRTIMAHAGDTITLLYGAADLDVGLDVTALPGCEHTWAACVARGNTDNYGGALFMPVKNPYDGESMSWA